ncbi:uncharacterized protein LOC141618398 [Silene latifolia]|uniref:uncharacterized protein LOC141618398 n=1 Tax=Silene latifolia TaxID=37657 RepID=UPI003D78965F
MDGLSSSFNRDSSSREPVNVDGINVGLTLASMPYERESSKRKRNDTGEASSSKNEIYLDLDLGFSGNFSSETDLSLGTNWLCNDKHFRKTTKVPDNESPKVGLELSLSVGGGESDLTSIGFETRTLSSIHQLVDEGSTSSKWKQGALVALVDQLQASKAAMSPKQQGRPSVKPCQFPGCHKGARGASGRCISHGGGRRCQRPGCPKGAEGKTTFCKAHGGGRRCEQLGCTKSAEGRTNLCIAHGGGRRCTYSEGCNHAARGKSALCIRHGGGKRCKMENCTRSAEGRYDHCIAHGGGRRCEYPQCGKGAQGNTKLCKAHGGGKRCTFLGCTKGAEGSTLFCKGHGGGKRCSYNGGGVCPKSVHGGTLYCVAHGGGKRCREPGCTKSARGRTDFCVRHGGGKRCKFESCKKSAQGSTDFCKAHGGGKRCLWGKPGSGFGEDCTAHCDKAARGKLGLCATHVAQVQDKRVHGNGTVGLKMKEIADETRLERWSPWNVSEGNGHNLTPDQIPFPKNKFVINETGEGSNSASLPEGRVHGGSLMAMLRGG